MYELTVFYTGPLYKWAGKIDEKEVLKRKKFRTFFFARVKALAISNDLNNVAWKIVRDEQVIAAS